MFTYFSFLHTSSLTIHISRFSLLTLFMLYLKFIFFDTILFLKLFDVVFVFCIFVEYCTRSALHEPCTACVVPQGEKLVPVLHQVVVSSLCQEEVV